MTRYLNEKYYEKDVFDVFHGDVQIPSCEVNQTHVLQFKRKTIAVVVIPGIMGSRLRRGKKTVWDPDAPIANMVWEHGRASPQKRFIFFVNGSAARVPITEPHPDLDHRQYPEATARGWNGMWSKYFDLLKALHDWRTPLKTYIDFPVYAFPYDWMLSNVDNAEKLRDVIKGIVADTVILVSHSMGGLLARCYLKDAGMSGILGVIHGAQPVVGAPAAYRRQLAGFEGEKGLIAPVSGITNWCLGTDGPKVSAIYPFCAGGLELLPSAAYTTNEGKKAWLHIQKLTGKPQPEFLDLPSAGGDPFEEIYAKTGDDEFWGMIHPEWIFENGLLKMEENLNNAKNMHDEIDTLCHPRTLQLFSRQNTPTVCEVFWRHDDVTKSFLDARVNYIAMAHGGDYWNFASCNAVIRKKGQGEYNRLFEVYVKDTEIKLGREIDFIEGLETIRKMLEKNSSLRIYHFYMTEYDEAIQPLYRSHGDGTVPVSSAVHLQPDLGGWEGAAGALPSYPPPEGEARNATGWSNTAEHSTFFSGAAIQATLSGIHNLALLYLQKKGTL